MVAGASTLAWNVRRYFWYERILTGMTPAFPPAAAAAVALD